MSQNYVQAFPYCFLEPCCLFSADPAGFFVGEPPSARNMFTLQLWRVGWGESSVHNLKKGKQHQWQDI